MKSIDSGDNTGTSKNYNHLKAETEETEWNFTKSTSSTAAVKGV